MDISDVIYLLLWRPWPYIPCCPLFFPLVFLSILSGNFVVCFVQVKYFLSTIILGASCLAGSVLPSACVCVSGGASHASLEKTRLFRGYGAGLMVCGKAEASATDCSFEGMGAAGEPSLSLFCRVEQSCRCQNRWRIGSGQGCHEFKSKWMKLKLYHMF